MKAPLKIGLNVPFHQAIKAAQQRDIVLPDVYYGELQGLARQLSFSIAGITAYDQLEQVKNSLSAGLQRGISFNKWKNEILDNGILDLPAHRLDNIFRTNIQNSYNRGRWEKLQEVKATRPYLMYDAINDSRVRPNHLALDGIIKKADSSFWNSHAPSLGFRCRCRLISLTKKQAMRRSGVDKGLNKPVNLKKMQPDKGWDYNPGADLTVGVKRAIDSKPASKLKTELIENSKKSNILLDNATMKNIHRSPWSNDFPAVDIYAKEGKVKSHSSYQSAKTGNLTAAMALAKDLISQSKMKSLNRYRQLDPIVLPVMGIEGVSDNVIPNALAVYIANTMRFKQSDDIVQTTKAAHTGASGWWRLLSHAAFVGDVVIGGNYIIIDDFIGMGGTFANLRGYIESRGGKVIKTVSLTGKPRSVNLKLTGKTLEQLRKKHGQKLELWWRNLFGYGFEEFTESEANYLIRTESFNTIRDKIINAAQQSKQ